MHGLDHDSKRVRLGVPWQDGGRDDDPADLDAGHAAQGDPQPPVEGAGQACGETDTFEDADGTSSWE